MILIYLVCALLSLMSLPYRSTLEGSSFGDEYPVYPERLLSSHLVNEKAEVKKKGRG